MGDDRVGRSGAEGHALIDPQPAPRGELGDLQTVKAEAQPQVAAIAPERTVEVLGPDDGAGGAIDQPLGSLERPAAADAPQRVGSEHGVSGHRLSTAEVESAIVSHPKVAEAAVIGQADEDTGQSICAFVTLEGDVEGTDEQVDEIREHVAKKIGKLARPKRIVWSADLPKTRSGKIMRRLLRDIAEGRELGDVTTLRDPDVMSQLEGR